MTKIALFMIMCSYVAGTCMNPIEMDTYYDDYGLNQSRLQHAKKDVIVMHPGPINRGVEIESSVADGPNSVILNQVSYGISVRMAIMSILFDNNI